MSIWANVFRQCFFIPPPTLTEKNLPDQTGRVAIVTGGYAGVGEELCKIIYGHNGTVYVAGRSQQKADRAIEEIKKAHPSSDGRIEFLQVDLSDLASIKPAVENFLAREQRLDVLTNNAGVMIPPEGTKDVHGREITMSTNCTGPFLFTKLLTPLLQKTAASSPAGSVRVTWASSLGHMWSPTGGVAWEDKNGAPAPKWHGHNGVNYFQSKGCNNLLAAEYQARYGDGGIISNAWNPGNLKTELQRHTKWYEALFINPILYPAIYGAYTELYAGWGEEAGKEDQKGAYIGPWGRVVMLRKDLHNSPEAKKFWEWCEEVTKSFA